MSDFGVSRETGPVPPAAADLAGDRLDLLTAYTQLLADVAVPRGLIGPREVPRLWNRHILNCAVAAPSAPKGSALADVGSGAGLPGMVWAICRTDLTVTLVEPLLRRVTFLNEAVRTLGIGNVEVVRARAEDLHNKREFDVVVSRAVAPLDRLSGWCLPLVRQHGVMVALKGASVRDELRTAAPVIERLGGATPELVEHGTGTVDPATWTVVVKKRRPSGRERTAGRASPRRGRSSVWG